MWAGKMLLHTFGCVHRKAGKNIVVHITTTTLSSVHESKNTSPFESYLESPPLKISRPKQVSATARDECVDDEDSSKVIASVILFFYFSVLFFFYLFILLNRL